MKRFLLFSLAVALLTLVAACDGGKSAKQAGVCRIHGVASNPNLEGKRIFLVPLVGPATAANVDSIEIHQGRFEFQTDTMMMAKILIDYHFRDGFQPLLVVVEPGDVDVVIDSVSSAKGTPQNDSLQQWKIMTERHNFMLAQLRRTGKNAEADSVHLTHKKATRRMAANMKEGLLHDFLEGLYPLTYQKKMPDGRIVTINSDTHEEVK